jgi:hypothetical protein
MPTRRSLCAANVPSRRPTHAHTRPLHTPSSITLAESAAMSAKAVEPPSWSGRYITDQSLAELFQMPVKLKKRISKQAGHTPEPSPAKSPSGASPAAKDTVCRIAIPRVGNLEGPAGILCFDAGTVGSEPYRIITEQHRASHVESWWKWQLGRAYQGIPCCHSECMATPSMATGV